MCSSSALPTGIGGWPLLARVTWQSRWHPEGLAGQEGQLCCHCWVPGVQPSPVLTGSCGTMSGTPPSLGFVSLGS